MLSAAAILEAISSYNTNTIRIIQCVKTIIIMQAYKKAKFAIFADPQNLIPACVTSSKLSTFCSYKHLPCKRSIRQARRNIYLKCFLNPYSCMDFGHHAIRSVLPILPNLRSISIISTPFSCSAFKKFSKNSRLMSLSTYVLLLLVAWIGLNLFSLGVSLGV